MFRISLPVAFGVALLTSFAVMAQEKVNFNQHIAPIIHTNCTPCHRPGEVGPFSLITYEDVAKRSKFIKEVTRTRYMPPWFADPAFQHYQNERLLTQQEIDLIARWVEENLLEMRYQHLSTDNEFKTGRCLSRPEQLSDGRLRMHEEWQWTSSDQSSGTSIIEEI